MNPEQINSAPNKNELEIKPELIDQIELEQVTAPLKEKIEEMSDQEIIVAQRWDPNDSNVYRVDFRTKENWTIATLSWTIDPDKPEVMGSGDIYTAKDFFDPTEKKQHGHGLGRDLLHLKEAIGRLLGYKKLRVTAYNRLFWSRVRETDPSWRTVGFDNDKICDILEKDIRQAA